MAKLSSASIRLVMKKNRMNRHGEFPIYVVVCYGGRLEKSTGVSVLEKYWDVKREEIKKQCPNAPVLNKMLSSIKQRVIDRKNDFEYNGRAYTPSLLLNDCKIDFNASGNVYHDIMNNLVSDRRLKYKTIDRYKYSYNKLCEYIGRSNFIIDEINLGFLKDFTRWLNVSDGSKKNILACISSCWNYAIYKGIVKESDNPFKQFKVKLSYGTRDYCIDRANMKKLKDYWLDLCIDRNGGLWSYKDGVEDKLMKRYTKEFGILWFLMMYMCNGSAPIDVALLKVNNCSRVVVDGKDYWKLSFKRQKTGTDVNCLLKRDLFCLVGFEHYLGFAGRYIYPIISDKAIDDKQIMKSVHKASEWAIRAVREAFKEINENTIRSNVENGLDEPLVEVDKVDMYTARHSFASNYLNSEGATIAGAASLLSRSANTIATYIHQLKGNSEIASSVSFLDD